MIRKPIVAGQFYPSDEKELRSQIDLYLKKNIIPQKVIGIVAPHAGYMCSGRVAGEVYASVIIPEKCIIISPNHTGHGKPASLFPDGTWETPLADINIDSDLAKDLAHNCSIIEEDYKAHTFEHSLEVQLPFLVSRQPKLSIVPLTVAHLNYDACKKIGAAIAKTIKDSKQEILIVASSDMNHYENQETTNKKDRAAIEKILNLDHAGLLQVCGEKRITMCGVVPTTIMLIAAQILGATKAKLIKYETSGDVLGDFSSVVGYAGILII
ncbi:MAG: AmmeMemoRadiSam system protein B [Deltaproteobacteria bacterium CG07_land_8_20_14_0_80_38_7]|nr:MAG: AmmeMemoRadiSam system protein B [Deltaproteobacteria bacterium CG07_land_8_20_14_0_80_38_7]